jgi:hypothetical protein
MCVSFFVRNNVSLENEIKYRWLENSEMKDLEGRPSG